MEASQSGRPVDIVREAIENLIRRYEAQIARLEESAKAVSNLGLFETAAKYQTDIYIYRGIIADLNQILG